MAVESFDVLATNATWEEAAVDKTTVYVGLKGNGRLLVKPLETGVDPASVGGEITLAWGTAGTPTSISYNDLPEDTTVWVKAGQAVSQNVSVQCW